VTHATHEDLVALWTRDVPAAEADALEAHLFACDDCAAASEKLGALAAGLREVIPPVISHAHRDRLAAAGHRLRFTPVDAGKGARAVFSKDVDFLVHVLRGDFSRAERVDVEVLTPDGTPRLLFEHVPFDAKAGEVLIACQRHYQHMFPGDPVFRVHAVEDGERRRVGDYVVAHEWL
jgi:hypothetical protein